MKYYVYCLFKHGEARPFYFGVTRNLRRRRKEHRKLHKSATYFCVIDVCRGHEEGRDLETRYIHLFAEIGWPLVNKDKNPLFLKAKNPLIANRPPSPLYLSVMQRYFSAGAPK